VVAISPGTNVTITGAGTTASPYVISSAGGSGGSGGSGHITILPWSYVATTGTWSNLAMSGSPFTLGYQTSTNGNSVTYNADLVPGTYSCEIFTVDNSDHGKFDLSFAGSVVSTVDTYTTPINWFKPHLVTGIVVSTGGITPITLTINGKNSSSSGYGLGIVYIALWRTS
jgi:hypothetical protein